MSERLQWREVSPYCLKAPPDYSVCKIGSAAGWSYEVWIGSEQKRIGLPTATRAQALCQRHYDKRCAQENANVANAEPA